MNLKLRFAFLFTFFVALILIISSATVYFVYYSYRESEFFERVKNEGIGFQRTLSNDDSMHHHSLQVFSNFLRNSTVYNERIVVADINGSILHRIPAGHTYIIQPAILQSIKQLQEYYWYDNAGYQYVGLLINNGKGILIAGGYDMLGLEKLDTLKIILIAVLAGALLLTAFVSFVFVREAFKPLKQLSEQMQATTTQNLGNKVDVGKARGEISDIANSYNAMLGRLGATFDFQKSFVFHASHEFRTPLATMLSETEAALNRQMTVEEYKKLLASLKEEQQDLIELTNSLLLISQSEDMGYTKSWPMLRIDEVLYDTISHSRKMLPSVVIEMGFGSMPESADDFVIQGNEILLRSIFSNLIKNAYMYSIDQQVKILLESSGDTILVHFDNTGTQLPADEKENILLPFFRGGNALKTKGYGLGLAIVARFIAVHRGTILYTPISNDVNRFTIALTKAPD